MAERELITVGFGNFATLVATQWVNGTSRYDVEHRTLYTDAHIDDTVTGRGLRNGTGMTANSRTTRVPRLLLLDDTYEASAYCCTVAPLHRIDCLSTAHVSEDAQENDDSGDGMTRMVQSAQRHWWRRNVNDADAEEQSHDSSDDDDEEEDRNSRRSSGRGGGNKLQPWAIGHANPPPPQQQQQQHCDPTTMAVTSAHAPQSSTTWTYGAEDACSAGGAVPWWRFITTSLHRRSVLTRSPQQQREAGMHSHKFGYGLMHDSSSSRDNDSSDGGSATACTGLAREAIHDALRHQLEDSDRTQGLQCFTEGNSMFGGCAHRTLHDLWDDAGAKLCVVQLTLFTPPPRLLYGDANTQAADDVTVLNRLLATSMLSAPESAVYVPLELDRWEGFFGAPGRDKAPSMAAPSWLRSEQAVAQYVAAIADTALYGIRDGGHVDVDQTSRGGDGSDTKDYRESASGPAFYLDAWCRALRPAPLMRMTAALGALPVSLPPHRYASASIRLSSLLCHPGNHCRYPATHRPEHSGDEGGPLWEWLSRSPLLSPAGVDGGADESDRATDSTHGFTALTHEMTRRADTEAGRVLGHALSVRGVGDGQTSYSSSSSSYCADMMRYARAVGSNENYIPFMTRHSYPCSTTYPRSLWQSKDTPAHRGSNEENEDSRVRPTGVSVASHIVNTYSSAAMLRGVVTEGQEVWRTRGHRYRDGYGLERDEWAERLEEVWQMHDDYHHGEPSNQSSDDDDACGANE